MTRADRIAVARRGVAAGVAGGIAEIVWVSAYAAATGASTANLARGVTTAAGASALLPAAPVALGVVIHMVLAVALGVVLAFAWRTLAKYWPKAAAPYAFALAALAGVWATNFFIILPLISPDFVQLVPYPVSLLSKLLFGLAAAAVLRHRASEPIAMQAT